MRPLSCHYCFVQHLCLSYIDLLVYLYLCSQLFMLVCTSVDSATTALQSGASTYRCISKQMHYKTPISRMKSIELHENYITQFCLEKKKLFFNIILTQNHALHIPKVIEITINY